eukprot:104618-Chlamydomonas_euryale.AAC.1
MRLGDEGPGECFGLPRGGLKGEGAGAACLLASRARQTARRTVAYPLPLHSSAPTVLPQPSPG